VRSGLYGRVSPFREEGAKHEPPEPVGGVVEATGVFAGRTGRVDLSGTNDMTKFAAGEVFQDNFWIIKLTK
jgi:hypothetical protein